MIEVFLFLLACLGVIYILYLSIPLFVTGIDTITDFKISELKEEGELRKKAIHDKYAKERNDEK